MIRLKISHIIQSFLISVVTIIISSAIAAAQCPAALTFVGEAASNFFGTSVSAAGDVNNDGYADLIVGAYGYDAGGSNAGRAYVYSGQTGALLHTFTGEAEGDQFGYFVSGAGDVDNDGFEDVIVGAWLNDAAGEDAGRAYVYSGQTGALLHTFNGEAADDHFGSPVSGAGDVNNDGYADLIVGSRLDVGEIDGGLADVYSGKTGALLHTFTDEAVGDQVGSSVSGAGDVNNDGIDDLIVGNRFNDAGGNDAGRAHVYSGQTWELLHTFTGEDKNGLFGSSVSGAGDVNNDGFSDLIVGAYRSDTGEVNNIGRAYVYSGQTGALLHTFTGEAPGDEFGWSVSGAGDVNNDGFADLIVGAFNNAAGGISAGRAYVYSGQTGALLHTFTGEAPGDDFGRSVSEAGDVNNDGRADLIVGAQFNNTGGTDAGRAYVYLLNDSDGDGIFDACDPCPFDPANPCLCSIPGDADDGGDVNIGDAVYIVKYAFVPGSPKPPRCDEADADGSGEVNIADAVYIVKYAFVPGSPAPVCPNPGQLICL